MTGSLAHQITTYFFVYQKNTGILQEFMHFNFQIY